MADPVLLDLGPGDVHTPSAMSGYAAGYQAPVDGAGVTRSAQMISAAKRNSLAGSKFALPSQRKYPIHDAAHVRNAAARLAQAKKAGKISDADYARAKGRIGRAAKRFGIESEFNAGDKPAPKATRGTRIRAQLGPGGHLSVRHMSEDGSQSIEPSPDGAVLCRDVRRLVQGDEVDPTEAGVKLIGPSQWKDGSPVKLVWIQLAETGAWKGHSAGPFEMTSQTFSEIVQNFDKRGLPIAADFEHASEQDATSGTIPLTGAPAQGWAHKLVNRGPAGLWGLVEWLDVARDGIKAGNYAFLSPAIRFGTKDPGSGQPAGARLTSFAITNQPFLTGLDGLRAASDKSGPGTVVMGRPGLDQPVHSPHHYMPLVRQCLKMDALCTGQECSDKLSKLRDMCMKVGPTGMHMGEDMSPYTKSLADMIGAQPGMSWEDVFDKIEDMIDHAIAEHEAEYHEGGPEGTVTNDDSDPAGEAFASTDTETTTMEDQKNAVLLTEANTKVTTLTAQVGDLTTKLATAEARVVELSAKEPLLSAKDGEIKILNDKVNEAEKRASDAEKALKEVHAAEEVRTVDARHMAYKDKKPMAKEAMLALFRSDAKLFDAEFPPVDPALAYLMRDVTPIAVRPGPDGVPMTVRSLALKLMKDRGISFDAAMIEADQQLRP